MKNLVRNISILVFVLLTAININAQTPDMLMQQANADYQKEQWNEAIDGYEKILNQGVESAPLYFNLGNAYFKSGALGKAILNYEKALKLEPGDDDVQFNLNIANARTVDKINEVPKLFLLEWWDMLVAALTPSGWAFVVFIFYLVLLVSIGLYLLTGSLVLQKTSIYSGIVSIAILVLSVIIMVSSIKRENSYNYGVLLTEMTTAKVTPDDGSSDAFVIHEGLKFEIQDHVNEWTKIKLPDGKIGWLPQSTFEQI